MPADKKVTDSSEIKEWDSQDGCSHTQI